MTNTAEGLAADINGDFRRLHAAAKACGLHFPITREPWHVQPVEAHSSKYIGRVLGPATAVSEKEEDVEMFIFGVSEGSNPTENGLWLLAGDGRAHHIPKPGDVEALRRAGVKDAGELSRDFLLRFERVHPDLGPLP